MRSLLVSLVVLAAGCAPAVRQIGRVNMISNRNVEPSIEYSLVSSYAGGSTRELRRARAETIEQAIDDTVKKVPGGEFLMNARIFVVNGEYFAVEGDVWGRAGNLAYRGFSVGDSVTFKTPFGIKTGVIQALRDDKTCFVKSDDSGAITEFKYDALVKAGSGDQPSAPEE